MTKFNKQIKAMSLEQLCEARDELRKEIMVDNTKIGWDTKPKKEIDIGKMKYKKRNLARVLTEISARESELE